MLSDSQQEQLNPLEEQPLILLKLFRKRQATQLTFTQQTYAKLYNVLCCTICLSLMSNPVFLRCSHRFCKQCIQKYIRLNEKRSCPNCRGRLTTKRDLYNDYSLTSVMNFAFGDLNQLRKKMQTIDQKVASKISNQIKDKRDRSLELAEQQKNESKMVKKIKVSESKQKGQIFHESQQQVSSINTLTLNKSHSQLITSKNNNIQKLQKKSPLLKKPQLKKESQSSILPSSPIQISSQDDQQPIKQLEDYQNLLKKQLGDDYLKKIIYMVSSNCRMVIKLVKLPKTVHTPQLPCSYIKVNLDTKIYDLMSYISFLLNVEENVIRLFIMNQDYIPIENQQTRLLDINQQYWNAWRGIQVYDMSDVLKQLDKKTKSSQENYGRGFYYAIDYRSI